MIKTLRITSIVAAVLAGVLFVFPVIFGVRSDPEAEQFLNSPGVIELFKKARSGRAKTGAGQSSPLVNQAKAFAKYLKPDRPKPPVTTPGSGPKTPIPLGPISAKFPLLATVVHESNRELSIALINEPGKGLRWVRQGSEVMHLIIEQVKEGLIVCRDGQGTSEILVEPRPTQQSLLEGKSSVSTSPSVQTSTLADAQGSPKTASGPPRKAGPPIASHKPLLRPPPQVRMSEEDRAAMEALGDKLQSLMKGAKSGKPGSPQDSEDMAAMMDALISDLKATRLSAEEARKLGDLGKKLKNVQQDPNRVRDAKITNPSRPIPPGKAK